LARFPGEFARLVGSPPFLPRDDQLARYMLSLCVTVRPISASVRPSVWITQTTPYYGQGTDAKISTKFQRGHPLHGGAS